jgi:outer membrane protein TolC
MNRFTSLAAAVATVFGTLASLPAAAQPRGRSQANSASPGAPVNPASPSEDEGDGPEARGAAVFKLDDIIEAAVRLSPDIARARSDREAARQLAGAAGKDQEWVLSASANYQRDALGADVDSDRVAPLTPLSTDVYSGTIGVGRNLPTGGNLALELGIASQKQELLVPAELLTSSQPGAQQPPMSECGENVDIFCQAQTTAKLTFKQPLARGLGSDVALAPQHRADLQAAEATVKSQLAAEQMIRDIVTAYWDLAFAVYEVDTRAQSLDLARKQEQVTRQEMRAGTATQNALDAVLYEIALREESLLTSKLGLEQKSLELRRKAGLEIGRRDVVIRPADALELDNQEWSVDDVLARSHKANRQIATAVLDKKLADIDVDVAHNGILPQIDLSLSGTIKGTSDTLGDSFSGLGGDSNRGFGYTVVAGVTMSFELSGAARAQHAAALARRHRLDIDRVDLERNLDAQIVAAVKTLMSGRTRVALADKAILIGEDNVKVARANFLAQRTDNFQVMNRQTQLIEARLRRGQAVHDYRVAAAQLQYLAGTLLDTYRIHVRTPAGRDE